MARLAIVLLAVFWAVVTVGSLAWEVVDPASLSAEQQPQALPPGLTGQNDVMAAQPTLAELTPGLRASLRQEIASEPPVTVPSESPRLAERGSATGKLSPLLRESAGDASSVLPSELGGGSDLPAKVRPRPRPEQRPTAAVAATAGVKVLPARPAVAATKGDAPRTEEAQSLLSTLGYSVGAVDGRMGPQTRAAIKAYEKKSGLKVDGQIDDQLLVRLRADAHAASREKGEKPKAAVASPAKQTLTGRVLGGVQRLIAHDFNSATAPETLATYCDERGDEWIYDRGLDRMRSCAEVVGKPTVAFRPLPGDR